MVPSKRLKDLAKKFKQRNQRNPDNHLKRYENLSSLDLAIKDAAMAIMDCGKRYYHQRRIKKRVLQQVKRKLLGRGKDIERCNDFDRLIHIVEEEKVNGFGELSIYDTALRIGANLDIYPTKVYLHAGTREGASELGLDWKKNFLETHELPQPLRKLKPMNVEDFLCIYRSCFKARCNNCGPQTECNGKTVCS